MGSVADVRAIFEAKLKETPTDFNPVDLERVKDDKYIKRLINHNENDIKDAAEMLWDLLVWRKSVGASDINESNIRLDYIGEGVFFPYGRDVDGSLLLVFKGKKYFKGQKEPEELKKIIIYWLDRVEREENGKPITMFFDMDEAGLSNMDIELIKYLISLFKLYYPYFLNYIIIYNMPWVLSAAFKVVKTLLPAKAIEKLKFVNKDTLKEFVTKENALVSWGGQSNYTFEFVPEKSDHTPRRVTFAEQGDNLHSLGEMLRLVPNDVIVFKYENDDISGQLVITNMDESAVSFKIRTTSPEKFRVRPSSGTLASGASQTVLIVVQQGVQLRAVTRDRFLVMSVQIPNTDLLPKELAEVWQNSTGSKIDEYRLKCQFPETDTSKAGNTMEKIQEKPDNIANTLNYIRSDVDNLKRQVKELKTLQLVTLTLTGLVVCLCYFIYKLMNDNLDYEEKM